MRTILFAVLVFFSCLRMEARGMDDVTVYTTTTSRSLDLEKSTVSLGENENVQPGALEIRLDRQVRYQSLDGFGAAVTGSSAYNLSLMPKTKSLFGGNLLAGSVWVQLCACPDWMFGFLFE